MKPSAVVLVFACGVVGGCMAAGPPAPAQAPPPVAARADRVGVPLVLDRADFRLGATVQFTRIPTANELYELHSTAGLAHVLLTLPGWPTSYAELAPLQQTPPEADLIVVLPADARGGGCVEPVGGSGAPSAGGERPSPVGDGDFRLEHHARARTGDRRHRRAFAQRVRAAPTPAQLPGAPRLGRSPTGPREHSPYPRARVRAWSLVIVPQFRMVIWSPNARPTALARRLSMIPPGHHR